MRVTLLGTGGPRPDPTRQGPATLVQATGTNLVFDAGRGVAVQLARAGVGTGDIDAVLLTHHHFDHIGGLGDLLMAAWNKGRTRPLPVRGPPGTAEIITALFDDVYRRDIDYRVVEERALGHTLHRPQSMVEVTELTSARFDVAPGVQVTVGEVEHGARVLGLAPAEWATVGYRVTADGRDVTISGDAVAGRELAALAAGVDVLVMCAYVGADEITSIDLEFLVENVIAGAPQAAAIAKEADVGRLVLTHLREKDDDAIDRMRQQVVEIFDGEVIVGRDLLTIDV